MTALTGTLPLDGWAVSKLLQQEEAWADGWGTRCRCTKCTPHPPYYVARVCKAIMKYLAVGGLAYW